MYLALSNLLSFLHNRRIPKDPTFRKHYDGTPLSYHVEATGLDEEAVHAGLCAWYLGNTGTTKAARTQIYQDIFQQLL